MIAYDDMCGGFEVKMKSLTLIIQLVLLRGASWIERLMQKSPNMVIS